MVVPSLGILVLSILVSCHCVDRCQGLADHPKLKPVNATEAVPNRYIVVMKEAGGRQRRSNSDEHAVLKEAILQLNYSSIGNSSTGNPEIKDMKENGIGVTVEMNDAALQRVLELEEVEFVEQDHKVSGTTQEEIASGLFPIELGWHLDRIDQRNLPLNGQFNPAFTGNGVDIYILDSGVQYNHSVFGERVSFGGYDFSDGNGTDCNGHGTQVAGLAGGKTTGVATEAKLYSVKVLDCHMNGLFSWVIEGLEHVIKRVNENSPRRVVVTMSLIGTKSYSLDIALKKAFDLGVVMVASAGNFRADACDFSPSSSPYVITVGATKEEGDGLFWFNTFYNSPGTNYGECVNIFAPGQWVRSASILSDNHLQQSSGTSLAAPIVAGVAALLLEETPTLSAQEVMNTLISTATPNVLNFSVIPSSAVSKTPNLLVYIKPKAQAVSNPTTSSPTELPTTDLMDLPSCPSRVKSSILPIYLYSDINYWKSRGYVPATIHAYYAYNQLYFAVIFSYIGTARVSEYITYKDLTLRNAYYIIEKNKKVGFAVISMAPYTLLQNDPRIALIFKKDDSLAFFTLVSMEMPIQRHLDDIEFLKKYNYTIALRRFRETGHQKEYMRCYAIYVPGPPNYITGNLYSNNIKNYINRMAFLGYYAIDLSTFNYKGTQYYSAIFNQKRFGCGQYKTMISSTQSNFYYTVDIYRNFNYHLTSMVPMPTRGFPGYIGIYWKSATSSTKG